MNTTNLSHEELINTHKSLVTLRTTRINEYFGICTNLANTYEELTGSEFSRELHVQLKDIMWRWPKHSGNERFPVAISNCPESDYYSLSTRASMWDANTEYGALRYELLEFLISEYEKLIAASTDNTINTAEN